MAYPSPPAPPPRPSAAPGDAEPDLELDRAPCSQAWCGEMDYPTFDHERGADADGDGLGVGDQQGDEPKEGDDDDADDDGDEHFGDLDGDESEDDPPRLPQLDEDTVSDTDALTWAIDDLVTSDLAAVATQHQIIALQELLQPQLTPALWAELLAMEEASTARWADLALVLVRWAWDQGLRCGREEG